MASNRFSLVEYDPPVPLIGQIAGETGLSASRVTELMQNAGERVTRSLGFSNTPLQIAGQRVQATDFAGLLRVSPAIELEVAPKFLGSSSSGWREDFFFLAMLSRHGRLLSSDRLRAVSSPNTDLATLVSRALVQMFWDQHRRPIRTYRRQIEQDFAIEGDVDPEEFRAPSENGFSQTVIRFDRANPFNAAIQAACASLHPEVSDSELRADLERIMQRLGVQNPLRNLRPHRLPSRSRSWRPTYDLAIDVIRGFGLTYDGGRAVAPGFVLPTWQVWEDLVTISLRARLGGPAVAAQRGIQLGHRQRQAEDGWSTKRSLEVIPDLRVDGSKVGFGQLLIDAKYKGRWHLGRQRIVEADLYEAMAFAQADKAKQVVLVYPKSAHSIATAVGTTTVFERIEVDDLMVWGVEIETRGIANGGGLKRFAEGFLDGLRSVAIGLPA